MAESYRGLTIRIGGDTTKLQDALKGINPAISQAKSELIKLNQATKLDPGNYKLVGAQMSYMGQQAENVGAKIALLRDSLAKVGQQTDFVPDGRTLASFSEEIENAGMKLAQARAEATQANKSLAKLHTTVSDTSAEMARLETVKLSSALGIAQGKKDMEELGDTIDKTFSKVGQKAGMDDEGISAYVQNVKEEVNELSEVLSFKGGDFDVDAIRDVFASLPSSIRPSQDAIDKFIAKISKIKDTVAETTDKMKADFKSFEETRDEALLKAEDTLESSSKFTEDRFQAMLDKAKVVYEKNVAKVEETFKEKMSGEHTQDQSYDFIQKRIEDLERYKKEYEATTAEITAKWAAAEKRNEETSEKSTATAIANYDKQRKAAEDSAAKIVEAQKKQFEEAAENMAQLSGTKFTASNDNTGLADMARALYEMYQAELLTVEEADHLYDEMERLTVVFAKADSDQKLMLRVVEYKDLEVEIDKTVAELTNMSSVMSSMELPSSVTERLHSMLENMKVLETAFDQMKGTGNTLENIFKADPSNLGALEASMKAYSAAEQIAVEEATRLAQEIQKFDSAAIAKATDNTKSAAQQLFDASKAAEEAKTKISVIQGEVDLWTERERVLKATIDGTEGALNDAAEAAELFGENFDLDNIGAQLLKASGNVKKYNAMLEDAKKAEKEASDALDLAKERKELEDTNAKLVKWTGNIDEARRKLIEIGDQKLVFDVAGDTSGLGRMEEQLNAAVSRANALKNALELDPTNLELARSKAAAFADVERIAAQYTQQLSEKMNSIDTSGLDALKSKYGTVKAAVQETANEIVQLGKKIDDAEDELAEMVSGKGFDDIREDVLALSTDFDSRLTPEIIKSRNALKQLKSDLGSLSEAHGTAVLGQAAEQMGDKISEATSKVRELSTFNMSDAAMMQALQMMSQYAERAGQAIVESANTIDSAYRDMRKTVQATDSEFENLKDSAIEFSQTHAVSADTILEIESLGGQLGLAASSMQEFGETISNLDIATDMSADELALKMGQLQNVMNDFDDTEFTNAADAVVRLGNNMAAQESSIINVAQRMSSVANVAKMSTSDLFAWSAAIASTGQRSESAATAVSNTMSGIATAVAAGGKSLAGFASIANMSAEKFAQAWENDPTTAMKAFIKGLNGMSDSNTEAIAALDAMGIKAVRQKNSLLGLASTMDTIDDALAMSKNAWNGVSDSWGKAGDAANEAQNKSEGFSGKLAILQNNLENLAASLGDGLVPMMEAAASAISVVTDMFNGMPPFIKQAISSVGVLAVALGLVSTAMNAMGFKTTIADMLTFIASNKAAKTATDGLTTAVGTASASTDKLTTSESAATTGAEALAVANNVAAESARNLATEIGAAKTAVDGLADAEGAATVADGLGDAVDAASDAVEGFAAAGDAVVENVDDVAEAVVGAAAGAETLAVAEGTATATTGTLTGATGMLSAALNAMPWVAAIGVIAAFAVGLAEAHDKQEEFRLATEGLSNALNASSAAYDSYASNAGSIDSVGEKFIGLRERIEETTAAQAELANQMSEDWGEIGLDEAKIDAYVDKFEELADAQKNGADATTALNGVADNLNDIMNTSISVIDDETGALKLSADQVRDIAEAYKEKARQEQAQNDYAKELEQNIDLQQQLADAIAANAEIEKQHNDGMQQYTGTLSTMGGTAKVVAYDVDGLREKLAASDKALAELESSASESEHSFDSIGAAMEFAGVKTSDYASLTEEQMEKVRQAFVMGGSTVSALASALGQFGVAVDGFASDVDSATDSVDNLTKASDEAVTAMKRAHDAEYTERKRGYDDEYTALKRQLDAEYDAQKNAYDAAYDAQKAAFDKEYDALKDALDAEYDALKDAYDAEYDALKDKLDAEYDALKDALDKEYAAYKKQLDAIYDAQKKAYDKELDAMKKAHDAEESQYKKHLDSLYNERKKSYDKQYDAYKKENDKLLAELKKAQQKETKAFKDATSDRIAEIKKEYDAKKKYLEENDGRKQIDEQIDAMNEATKAEQWAAKLKAAEEKKAELQLAVDRAKTRKTREEAEKNLQEHIADMEQDAREHEREEEIKRLNERKQDIKDLTDLKKDALDTERDNKIKAYEAEREAELERLSTAQETDYNNLKDSLDAENDLYKEKLDERLAAYKERLDARLQAMKDKHDEEEAAKKEQDAAELERLKAQHEAILALKKAQNEAELAARKAQNEAELAELKAQQEALLAERKAANEAQLQALKDWQTAELDAMKLGQEAALQELKNYHEDVLTEKKRQHEDALTQLKNDQEDELNALKTGYDATKTAVAEKSDELKGVTDEKTQGLISDMLVKLGAVQPAFKGTFANSLQAVVDEIEAGKTPTADKLGELTKVQKAALEKMPPEYKGAAELALRWYNKSLEDAKGPVQRKSGEIKDSTLSGLNGLDAEVKKRADLTLDGLTERLEAGKDPVGRITKSLAETVLGTYDSEMRINSPSEEMKTRGGYTVDGLVEGMDDKKSDVTSKAEDLADAVTDGLEVDASGNGEDAGNSFADGIDDAYYNVSTAASSLSSAASDGMADAQNWTHTSGYNAGINFADGLSSAYSWVVDAARRIADTVASYLHHSTPDKGPLRDDDKWGADLVQNLIYGMKSRERALSKQSKQLATRVRDEINSKDISITPSLAESGADVVDELVASMREREGALAKQMERMSRIVENGFDPRLTIDAAYEAIEAINAGHARTMAQQLASSTTNNQTVNINVTLSDVTIREDADIRKLAEQLAQLTRRQTGARLGW